MCAQDLKGRSGGVGRGRDLYLHDRFSEGDDSKRKTQFQVVPAVCEEGPKVDSWI